MEDGGEEVMDTLSELHITGARSRGDGLGMGRPMWLQGRERKQAGGIGVARGTHNADSFAAMGREAGQGIDTDSFQMAGGGRRRREGWEAAEGGSRRGVAGGGEAWSGVINLLYRNYEI